MLSRMPWLWIGFSEFTIDYWIWSSSVDYGTVVDYVYDQAFICSHDNVKIRWLCLILTLLWVLKLFWVRINLFDRYNPKIYRSIMGGIRMLFKYSWEGSGVFTILYENRILLYFVGSNLNPLDFSNLPISSMAFRIRAFDVFVFLSLQYILQSSVNIMVLRGAGIIRGNSL